MDEVFKLCAFSTSLLQSWDVLHIVCCNSGLVLHFVQNARRDGVSALIAVLISGWLARNIACFPNTQNVWREAFLCTNHKCTMLESASYLWEAIVAGCQYSQTLQQKIFWIVACSKASTVITGQGSCRPWHLLDRHCTSYLHDDWQEKRH